MTLRNKSYPPHPYPSPQGGEGEEGKADGRKQTLKNRNSNRGF